MALARIFNFILPQGVPQSPVMEKSCRMPAVIMKKHGGLEVLEICDDFPCPRPSKSSHVVVAIAAAGLNPCDFKLRRGPIADFLYPKPKILGPEYSPLIITLLIQNLYLTRFRHGWDCHYCPRGIHIKAWWPCIRNAAVLGDTVLTFDYHTFTIFLSQTTSLVSFFQPLYFFTHIFVSNHTPCKPSKIRCLRRAMLCGRVEFSQSSGQHFTPWARHHPTGRMHYLRVPTAYHWGARHKQPCWCAMLCNSGKWWCRLDSSAILV